MVTPVSLKEWPSIDELIGLIEERLADMGGLDCLFKFLHSNPEVGVVNADESMLIYGRNELPRRPARSLLSFLLASLNDRILIMLTAASIISIGIGMYEHIAQIKKYSWIEGVAIMTAVVVVVLVNGVSDWHRDKQFIALNDLASDVHITVIRSTTPQRISATQIVPGEIVVLQPGDLIPADGFQITNQGIQVDESTMTGESRPVNKTRSMHLMAGTKVLDGEAKMIVTSTGAASSQGHMLKVMHEDRTQETTPLQLKLADLAELIAKIGLTLAAIMLIGLGIRLTIEAVKAKPQFPASKILERILGIFIQTITVVVVAIPEGLPMAVTVALAYATTRMLSDNNLVRIMASCETMGTVTCICTDKTGTLTENRMSVVEADADKKSDLVEQIVILNSTAYVNNGQFVGSATEIALLRWIRCSDPGLTRSQYKIVERTPFSSERKYMSTTIRVGEVNRKLLKGASEIILGLCERRLKDGTIVPLDNIQECQELIQKMASRALRTIALAYADDDGPLILVGILGIADPLRLEVIEAVKQCQQAGIFVRMLTGDNKRTAEAIAREAGILTPGGIVIEGPEFRSLTSSARLSILPRLQVMARSSPDDKQKLVRDLRQTGQVIAVTGDGTNDGPALRAAHVGFAMGITGTEVAKAASSIILLDDNFASLVKAASWGRSINAAVRKFLAFQLTVNVSAVSIAMLTAFIDPHGRSIISAVQLLWINLVMDSFGALALATDPPDASLLTRPPDNPALPLITRGMWRMILSQSFYQIIVMCFIAFVLARLKPSWHIPTIAFNAFVWMQLFNEINCRFLIEPKSRNLNPFRNLHRNWFFPVIWIGSSAIQVILVFFGGIVFGTKPIGWAEWLICLSFGVSSLLLNLLVRLIPMKVNESDYALYQSPEKIRWQTAARRLALQMRFYQALRGSKDK